MYFRKIGSGPNVVFLHGWGCDGGVFFSVAKRLPNYTCFMPDFRGFGRSPYPPVSGWDVEQYAEDLVVFFRMHNIQNASIVAHSFGCRVALVIAAKYPDLIRGLLFFAPAGIRKFSITRWFKVHLYKLKKLLGRGHTVCGSRDYIACGPEMKNTFVKVVNRDLSVFAKQVSCPVLIINGNKDSETPLSHARKLKKLIANSSLSVIDGDHFALFRNPAAFASTVQYFVEGLE